MLPAKHRRCSIRHEGRIADLLCKREVVLCRRREPTFNQPPIEGSFCDTNGRSEPILLIFCDAANVWFVKLPGWQSFVSDHTLVLNVCSISYLFQIRLSLQTSRELDKVVSFGNLLGKRASATQNTIIF
jgi:hypothetical protein